MTNNLNVIDCGFLEGEVCVGSVKRSIAILACLTDAVVTVSLLYLFIKPFLSLEHTQHTQKVQFEANKMVTEHVVVCGLIIVLSVMVHVRNILANGLDNPTVMWNVSLMSCNLGFNNLGISYLFRHYGVPKAKEDTYKPASGTVSGGESGSTDSREGSARSSEQTPHKSIAYMDARSVFTITEESTQMELTQMETTKTITRADDI